MYDGPHRYGNLDIFATASGPVAAHARLAVIGFEASLRTKVRQRVESLVADQVDTATVTTIATVRAAARNKSLATETDAAVAAVAGGDADYRFINEFHD